jgi:hypothetical protein
MKVTSIVFILAIFSSSNSFAAVRSAVSCAYTDVSAAYSAAGIGDTVAIPAGACTWSNTLTLTKAITLTGAGKDSTTITATGSTTLINISPPSDVPIRVTGIGFVLGAETGSYKMAIGIYGSRNNSYKLTMLRIDNNKFTKGNQAIFVSGWVYGVIDQNVFVNGYTPIFFRGSDNYDWLRPYSAGTADAMFIEDNLFTVDNNVDTTTRDSLIYIQEGASVVVRHNTFDTTLFTNVNWMTLILNNHGNQNYYTGGTDFRGQPIFESYNNTARVYRTDQFIGIRGGSVLIHDESYFATTGSPSLIEFTEEESWQTVFFSTLRTAWPAEDQINNSFIWNNTFNGSPITNIRLGYAQDPTFIQQNRDYFMHAPQASGGREIYTGRAGGPMTFSGSAPNAYYPYVPYIYPHPLRSTLPPPSNLRVM